MAEGRPLDMGMLIPGKVIPAGTILTGKITTVWGSLYPAEPLPPIPRVAVKLQCGIPTAPSSNSDYVLPPLLAGPSRTVSWMIKLSLRCDGQATEGDVRRMAQDLEKCRELSGLHGDFSVNVGGAVVVAGEYGKWRVELESKGERVFQKGNQIWRILSPIAKEEDIRDEAPAWYEGSSMSSPPSTSHLTESVVPPPPGGSKFRPLSAHSIPTISRPLAPTKRSSTPPLRPADPLAKRPRIDEALPPYPSKTVIQIQPAHLRTAAAAVRIFPSRPRTPDSDAIVPEDTSMRVDFALPEASSSPTFPSLTSTMPPPPGQKQRPSLPTPRTTPAHSSPPLQDHDETAEAKIERLERERIAMDAEIAELRRSSLPAPAARYSGQLDEKDRRRASEGAGRQRYSTDEDDDELQEGVLRSWTKREEERRQKAEEQRGEEAGMRTRRESLTSLSASAYQEKSTAQTLNRKRTSAGVDADASKQRKRREAEQLARAEAARRAEEREEAERAVTNQSDSLKRPFTVGGVTYTPLAECKPSHIHSNVMGVVIDKTPAKLVHKTGQYIVTIIIGDPTSHTDAKASDDFPVTIFRNKQEDLPLNVSIGTAMVFRGLKVTMYRDKPKGQAFLASSSTWASLPGGSSLVLADPSHMTPPLGAAEVKRLKALHDWWAAGAEGTASNTSYIEEGSRASMGGSATGMATGKMGWMNLGDVSDGMFVDLAFKILMVTPNPAFHLAYELYITDGTIHSAVPRNFHGVQQMHVSQKAIWCLAIKNQPDAAELPLFQVGKMMYMKNVRVKMHQGQLELIWSELPTDDQAREGWNRRRCGPITEEDERGKIIERRLKAMRRGENPNSIKSAPPPSRSVSPQKPSESAIPLESRRVEISPPTALPRTVATRVSPAAEIPLATHLRTIHQDPLTHPISTISEILQNRTIPNRFRSVARVQEDGLLPRGKGKDDGGMVRRHCGKCKRDFASEYCQSCNDVGAAHAELRWRLVIILEEPGGLDKLPVIVADNDAAEFLPALPPLSNTGPNERERLKRRIKQCIDEAMDILLGAKQDGERPRPRIDWSVEAYEVHGRGKGRGKGKGKGAEALADVKMRVWRVFGMKSGSNGTV